MNWKPWGSYAMKSECGKYSVARYHIADEKHYLLWELPAKIIGKFSSFAEAKASVEAELENVQNVGNGEGI